MKPQRVIQAGHLHALAHPRVGVRQKRSAQQSEIRHIREYGLILGYVIAQLTQWSAPHMLDRLPGLGVEHIAAAHGFAFDGVYFRGFKSVGVFNRHFFPVVEIGFKLFRGSDFAHIYLVSKTFFLNLERHRRAEDGNTVLLGHHCSGGKAAAVAYGVYLVDNLHLGVTGSQKVGVHGMCNSAFFVHGSDSGIQGLRQYLAAKDSRWPFGVLAPQ